ncbi:hypothetical protein [Peloplasma aerotolerans]|uniref:Integrase SAM-like N-terminal domain-containing protein n=1 Tax=Peloplasma aerotolerans TaxID=3044389 RepID=A0AAW6UCK9_9MOLU|nr:hypothetical protein [Mariniplasma sp. M4Ah]MDI6453694.1 hypothetical protein [Mariniplasma sp. M4Ah]
MNIHPLESLIKQYLEEKDITIGTGEVYQTILNQYLNYLKDHHISYAKTSDVMNYLTWKRSHIQLYGRTVCLMYVGMKRMSPLT